LTDLKTSAEVDVNPVRKLRRGFKPRPSTILIPRPKGQGFLSNGVNLIIAYKTPIKDIAVNP
jgi:hypothetical protein